MNRREMLVMTGTAVAATAVGVVPSLAAEPELLVTDGFKIRPDQPHRLIRLKFGTGMCFKSIDKNDGKVKTWEAAVPPQYGLTGNAPFGFRVPLYATVYRIDVTDGVRSHVPIPLESLILPESEIGTCFIKG